MSAIAVQRRAGWRSQHCAALLYLTTSSGQYQEYGLLGSL